MTRSRAGRRRSSSRSSRTIEPGLGELHRKIGTGLWHKADRESSIAHFQEGIDLLKDGDPCRELIELYEEAASLYVETGDNMLAIYAAEKAQRTGGGARAVRDREPCPPHLRTRLRPDRRSRAGAIEPRASGRAGPPGRARGGDARVARDSAATSRSPRPTIRRRRRRAGRRWSSPTSSATCLLRSSCRPRSDNSPSTPPTGPEVEQHAAAAAQARRARGPLGPALPAVAPAGNLGLAPR